MAEIHFTPHLKKHCDCPTTTVAGETLAAVFQAVFLNNPKLRGYVLDDQNRIRRHVMVFVDDRPLPDREHWDCPVQPDTVIHVMQALSGG